MTTKPKNQTRDSTSHNTMQLHDDVLLTIFSFIHIYEATTLFPQVCKQWKKVFDTLITTDHTTLPKQLIVLYEIWRYCDNKTPDQFVKIMTERLSRDRCKATAKQSKGWADWLASFICGGSIHEDSVMVSISPYISGDNDIIQVRVLFVGDDKVGKTTLYRSLITKSSSRSDLTSVDTVINPFHTREFNIRGDQYSILLLDGPVRSDIEIALLCFDITNRSSFESVSERWSRKTVELQRILVGLRGDESKRRQVSRDRAERLATEMGTIYVETSSRLYSNISQLYSFILYSQIYRKVTGKPLGVCATDAGRNDRYYWDDEDVDAI